MPEGTLRTYQRGDIAMSDDPRDLIADAEKRMSQWEAAVQDVKEKLNGGEK